MNCNTPGDSHHSICCYLSNQVSYETVWLLSRQGKVRIQALGENTRIYYQTQKRKGALDSLCVVPHLLQDHEAVLTVYQCTVQASVHTVRLAIFKG